MRGLAIVLGTFALLALSCNQPTLDKSGEAIDSLAQIPGYRQLDSLTKLIDKSPSNTDLLNERAKLFLQVGELDFALADIGRAILLDSSKADYFLTIADVYFQRNEPQRCLRSLKVARGLAPTNTEPLHRLAQFHLYIDKHQESIDFANEMLKIDPQDDRPFLVKALCFKDMGDTARAIQNYMLAVEQNPDNYDAQVELGILHWAQGKPIAASYLKNALAIRPDATDALYALGMVYQDAGTYDKAMETYMRLVQVDSTYRTAWHNMGYVNYLQKDYDTALVNVNRAVALEPNYHQAIFLRGLIYEARGDKEKAKREYSYVIQMAPNYKKAADGMARLLK